MNSLISLIIPVYNVEQYLRQCLDSVINQTYTNLEIILVDDGSTDNSGKICDEYALKDKRIIVIHKENGGVSSARNKGLEIAKGDYIGFVDSDDYIELDMYETLYNEIVKTNSQLVVCNWYEGTENNWIKNKKFPIKQYLTVNEALESFYWCMYVWNKLFNKNIIHDVKFSENCGYGEDILFCLEVYKRSRKIYCYNKSQYYYRQNKNSALNSHIFKSAFLEYINVLNIEMNYAKNNNLFVLQDKLCKMQIHVVTAWLGFIALQQNSDIESVHILLNYIKNKKKFINFIFKTKEKIYKKFFIIIACINFNLASRIYKFLNKIIRR